MTTVQTIHFINALYCSFENHISWYKVKTLIKSRLVNPIFLLPGVQNEWWIFFYRYSGKRSWRL